MVAAFFCGERCNGIELLTGNMPSQILIVALAGNHGTVIAAKA